MKFTYPSGSRPLEGYTIKRAIGRGGFGEVYYATSDGGKEVALKLVRRNLDVELRGVSHCLNLKHPNLLDLYDVKRDADGDTWVVMEFVGGKTLEDVLTGSPSGLPVDEVLAWFHGILAGVAYLHDRGIVHRDLKPGNVFCDEGVVKIGDYGLSKFIAASRRSGQTESVGTVHYMAPEVANGRYGKEIDIYALGIMLYEMLTGHVPFEGESVGEVLMKHLTAQPDVSALAEPFRTLVARALEKDPEKRIASVSAMLECLPASADGVARRVPHVTMPHVPRPEPAAAPVFATLVEDNTEPIWRAIRDNWYQGKAAWDRANLAPWQRVGIIIVALMGLMTTMGVWLPTLVIGSMAYGVYRVVRSIVYPIGGTPRPVATPPPIVPARGTEPAEHENTTAHVPPVHAPPVHAADSVPRNDRRASRYARREARRLRREGRGYEVPAKSGRERLTETSGSMLAAVVVVLVVCALGSIFNLIENPTQFTWLALTSTAGTWAVLIPANLSEGVLRGEATRRRFVMLIAGLLVGAFSWTVNHHLLADVPFHGGVREQHGPALPVGIFSDEYGASTLAGYLAFFGFYFPVGSWWDQVNPLRRKRFAIWPVVAGAFWGWVLAMVFQFPQPWGVMSTVVTIEIATQIASPWVDRRDASLQEAA